MTPPSRGGGHAFESHRAHALQRMAPSKKKVFNERAPFIQILSQLRPKFHTFNGNVSRTLCYATRSHYQYVAGTYIFRFTDPEKLKRIILVTTLFAGLLAIWKFVP
jgi:hypothetical protein